MKEILQDFRETVEDASRRMLEITPEQSVVFPAPGKWSRKQIVGHLIDSAANNHRRFVKAQFQDDLVFPGYDQEAWVNIQDYQQEQWSDLVQLWRWFNFHIAHVISCIPSEKLKQPRHPHSLDRIAWKHVNADKPATIEYMFIDYVGHMKNHLNQIFKTHQSEDVSEQTAK